MILVLGRKRKEKKMYSHALLLWISSTLREMLQIHINYRSLIEMILISLIGIFTYPPFQNPLCISVDSPNTVMLNLQKYKDAFERVDK